MKKLLFSLTMAPLVLGACGGSSNTPDGADGPGTPGAPGEEDTVKDPLEGLEGEELYKKAFENTEFLLDKDILEDIGGTTPTDGQDKYNSVLNEWDASLLVGVTESKSNSYLSIMDHDWSEVDYNDGFNNYNYILEDNILYVEKSYSYLTWYETYTFTIKDSKLTILKEEVKSSLEDGLWLEFGENLSAINSIHNWRWDVEGFVANDNNYSHYRKYEHIDGHYAWTLSSLNTESETSLSIRDVGTIWNTMSEDEKDDVDSHLNTIELTGTDTKWIESTETTNSIIPSYTKTETEIENLFK